LKNRTARQLLSAKGREEIMERQGGKEEGESKRGGEREKRVRSGAQQGNALARRAA